MFPNDINGGEVLSVWQDGVVMQGLPNAAPDNSDLQANSRGIFWVDESTDTIKLQYKRSDGTIKTFTFTGSAA